MKSKFGTVRNPLTIIAIFAGTAEVSGTAVLPFLQPENQTLYVWFLMIFPLAIVIFFFATLNWNYKVLYAPSDFENEDNFVSILQKASVSELIDKESKEIDELVENAAHENINPNTSINVGGEIPTTINIISTPAPTLDELAESLSLNNEGLATKETRKARNQVLQKIQRKSMDEIRYAEKLAFEKLEKELSVKIETGVKIQSKKGTYIFDGIIRQNNKLTAVETIFFRDMNSMGFSLRRVSEKLESIPRILSDEQRKDFSLIFVIVTDYLNDETISRINFQMNSLPFPVAVKYYELDKLAEELIQNVA